MYNKIENIYINGARTRINKKLIKLYICTVVLLLIANALNNDLIIIQSILLDSFFMMRICEKELNTKLYINFSKKDSNNGLEEIIYEKEKETLKKYLIKNEMYNEKSLSCLIEHYRNLITPEVIGNNMMTITTTIITIAIPFLTEENINIDIIVKNLPYVLSVILIPIMIYYFYRKIFELKSILTGNDKIYERLEELFSNLYIDFVKK